MSLHTVTEGAPPLVGSGPASEELSIAERFARDRAALKHPEPEERKAAVVRLVEAGSSAVVPLLRVVAEDTCMEVREAAIWSLFWLSSDFLGESREEYDSINRLLRYGSPKDRYLRVATEALWMKFQGESAAGSAANRLTDIDAPSRRAVLRFLRGMVEHAPLVDPDLKGVLRLMRWHPLASVRRCCAELSRTLLAQEATPVQRRDPPIRRRWSVDGPASKPRKTFLLRTWSEP